MNITGRYIIDPEKSAALQCGFFTDRFEMKPGYEEAVARFMQDHSEAFNGLSMQITDATVRLSNHDEIDEIDIVELAQEDGRTILKLDWEDELETFVVRDLGDQCIQLANEENELSQWAWRRER